MKLLLKYVIAGLVQRKTATLLTAFSFALVVMTLIALLAMVQGIEKTLTISGADDRFFAMSNKAMSEGQSKMEDRDPTTIESFDQIKIDATGMPFTSREIVATAKLGQESGSIFPQIIRGVDLERALRVHDGIQIVAGRFFRDNAADELIVGRGAQKMLGVKLNSRLNIRGVSWRVVGIFADAGSPSESEIWTSRQNIDMVFKRRHVSSVWAKVKSPQQTNAFVKQLNRDNRLQVYAVTENEYFSRGANTAIFYRIIGWFVTALLSVGAIFSAMNTMYASLMNRTHELAALRALGFGKRVIFSAIIVEASVLALAGAAVASLAAFFISGWSLTMNVPGIGRIVYQLAVSGGILVNGLVFAIALGLLSGWLPARSTLKLDIVTALRS